MAWIAPIAAAAENQREERAIERLRRNDPYDRYEYKILRSYRFAFGKADVRQAELAVEARSGWELAARLDSNRLILRRLRTMADQDHLLPPGVNPYRTEVDTNAPLLITLLLLGVVGLVVVLFQAAGPFASSLPLILALLVAGIIVVLGLALTVWLARR